MAAARRVMELEFTEEELADLERVSRSRTEPASHVQRARILLGYRQTPSLYATGRAIGVTHRTVARCLRRARDLGVKAALDDRPRPARERTISSEARTFVVDLACRKPKDLDYPHEVWTTRLLTAHVRERGPQVDTRAWPVSLRGPCTRYWPHTRSSRKVKYYLQNRAPEFAEKMAEVLEVYREVETLKVAVRAQKGDAPAVAIISCDEKPGIQALATTAPDLPPEPKVHETSRARSGIRPPGNHEPAGRPRSGDRRRSRPRRRKTSLARVRRPSQTDRRDAVVVAREIAPGDARLVAYVTLDQTSDPTVSEMRMYLRETLPDCMVPSITVTIDAIPLTSNGKVDRKALPDPYLHCSLVVQESVPPAAGVETLIAEIWRDLLKVEKVSATDNFFELGGHSLLALGAVSMVEKKTGWRMDPRTMYFQTCGKSATP